MQNFKTILTVSPHPDDVELGCGASVRKQVLFGSVVHHVILSDCSDTFIKTKFLPNTLVKESTKALKILGVGKSHIYAFRQINKHFSEESRKIFEILEHLKDTLHPDLVIMPSLVDTHEDHQVVAQQTLHVFRRNTSIISYEQPWNTVRFTPNLFVKLSAENLQIKCRALRIFESQRFLGRGYFDESFIRGWARMRGMQIDAQYAEAFEIVKLIM